MANQQDKHVERAKKKLREARFFLGYLQLWNGPTDESGRLQAVDADKPEQFEFWLSAYLSAAHSVIDIATKSSELATFFQEWRDKNPKEHEFLLFMRELRRLEVHHTGTQPEQGWVDIEVGNTYTDARGTVTIAAPPGTPCLVRVMVYYLTLPDGTSQDVVSLCGELNTNLHVLLRQYESHAWR